MWPCVSLCPFEARRLIADHPTSLKYYISGDLVAAGSETTHAEARALMIAVSRTGRTERSDRRRELVPLHPKRPRPSMGMGEAPGMSDHHARGRPTSGKN